MDNNVTEYVAGLIERARKAQKEVEFYTQEQVDTLSRAMAWSVSNEKTAWELADFVYNETQMGEYKSKYLKITKKIKGVLHELNSQKTVGVIDENKEKGIRKIAKPVGVIGALIPSTQPEITAAINGMCAVKGRNAIVFSPHPRSKNTTKKVVELMREQLRKYGAPEDLLICAENPTIPMSNEIMSQSDLVIATGGAGMVKAAYSSGTPAYGVGVGNAIVVVDETADLKDAAHKIMMSKTFDNAAGCSCENSLVINEKVYDEMVADLMLEGGYLATPEEKAKIQKAIWPDGHAISRDVVTQPVDKIASLAGIAVPEGTKFIMVEETGSGPDYLFSGEKLSLVMAVYRYSKFEDAIRIVNENQAYQGAGHSCGIHSINEDHIMELSLKTRTTRVMVRQPQSSGNSGDWANGMPWTVTLGCGTWGGNIASENIVMKHYINTTWVSTPIEPNIPTDEELFGDVMKG